MALTDKLTAIADAIRTKGGTTELLTLDGMVEAIGAISAGGGGGGPLYASGTYSPAEANLFMKVTGIGFTPKIFKIVVTEDGRLDGTAKSNGTVYIDGDCVWIGSNAAGTSYLSSAYFGLDTTPQSDDITDSPSVDLSHGILGTGFFSRGANRYWMPGYTYKWEAWG